MSLDTSNVDKMSDSDKRELQQVIQAEGQKAKIQECRSFYRASSAQSTLCVRPSFSATLRLRIFQFIDANATTFSRAQPYRYMLEEVHHRENIRQHTKQQRAIVYPELRGEILRLEYGGAEALGADEEQWEHVIQHWMESGDRVRARDLV